MGSELDSDNCVYVRLCIRGVCAKCYSRREPSGRRVGRSTVFGTGLGLGCTWETASACIQGVNHRVESSQSTSRTGAALNYNLFPSTDGVGGRGLGRNYRISVQGQLQAQAVCEWCPVIRPKRWATEQGGGSVPLSERWKREGSELESQKGRRKAWLAGEPCDKGE